LPENPVLALIGYHQDAARLFWRRDAIRKNEVEIMSQRRLAALTAAIVMITAGAFDAGAQQGRSDDWLGFDQSDGSEQTSRGQASTSEMEAQPEQGFPTLARENVAATKTLIRQYAEIVARGGWAQLPPVELRTGMRDPAVVQLRKRLQATGDLQSFGSPETYDTYVENAVKKAQARHGLPATGFLDKETILELNVPASARLRQLRTNLPRLQAAAALAPAGKYVVVNIPSVQIEAINNNEVVSRHKGVVGKPDRPSPLVNSAIEEINFNKDWFVPPTVLKTDLLRDASKKGKEALEAHKIDVYANFPGYQKGERIDADTIDWNSDAPLRLFYVQNGGPENPLGFVKLNFASPHHVYMHDTAAPSVFSQAFRAESSGCVRVQGIHRLVAWLLEDNGWSVQQVLRMKETGEKLNIRLKKKVPLFWVYITGWATQDGAAQFRRDLYRRDDAGA
jgi:murein L,D-transpeptidase YcbB/YkuD